MMILLVTPSVSFAQNSRKADCSQWLPKNQQNIFVDDYSVALLGPDCSSPLVNVSVVVWFGRGSSLWINDLHMVGGFVELRGSQNTPWNVLDVAVSIVNAKIAAVNGPAAGFVLGVDLPLSINNVSMRNVILVARNSALSSTSNAAGGGISSVLGAAPKARFPSQRFLSLTSR